MSYDSIDIGAENREWVDRMNRDIRNMRILSENGISFKTIEEFPLRLKCSFCGKIVGGLYNQTKEEAFFDHAQPHL